MTDSITELADYEAARKRRLKAITWAQLSDLPRRSYLVKGLVDCGGLSVLYGPSNCGKTFLALSLAVHVSLGRTWHGRRVRQGKVVYIACEGGLGVAERLTAFRLLHDIKDDPPLYVIPSALDLRADGMDTTDLIEEINSLGEVSLVIIDTLSRALAGGNENSPDDMGAFIRNCDRIREGIGCHLMVIHHSGKDVQRGARGHNSLRCAADTEMEVSNNQKTGFIRMEVKKQRDGKTNEKTHFALECVEIGKDDDGENLSSCALVSASITSPKKELTGMKRGALDVLKNCLSNEGVSRRVKSKTHPIVCVTIDEYREALIDAKVSSADKPDDIERVIRRTIDELNKLGLIITYKDFVYLPDEPDKTGRTETNSFSTSDGQDTPP